MDNILPPLPPCDEDSLARNKFDLQFRKGARDFWGDNNREQINLEKPKKCEHYFVATTDGVKCAKCHIGWISKEFEIRNGELYFRNKKIL